MLLGKVQTLFDIAMLKLLEGKGLSAQEADSVICYAPHTFYHWATPSVSILTSHLVTNSATGLMVRVFALEELGIPRAHSLASRVWELPATPSSRAGS